MSTPEQGRLRPLGEEFGWAVRALAEKAMPIPELRRLLASGAFPHETWGLMAGDGWFRALLPESAEGFGLGVADLGPAFGVVGECLLPGPLLDHLVALPLVYRACGAGDGPALLEPALRGERRVALVDPFVDADAAVRVSAVRLDGDHAEDTGREGAGHLVHGHVEYVRWAAHADDLIVLTEDAVVLVRADDPAVRIEEASLDLTSRLASVALGGASATPLLTGQAARALTGQLREAIRVMAACELAGIAKRLLDMAVAHAGQREQFGRPVGSFQAIKHLLASLAVHVEALGNLVERSLDDIAADPASLPSVSKVAKCYASSVGRRAAEDTLQVLGGIGFTAEHDLHLFFKRVLALQGLYGDERELALSIGRDLLGTEGTTS